MGMNPEIKTQWVAALRSGNYAQATGKLHRLLGDHGQSFCCLGVLCDLAVKAGVDIAVTPSESDGWVHYENNVDLPPASVRQWSGLPEIIQLKTVDAYEDLIEVEITELNDDYSYDFDQLATLIEEQL